MLLVDAAEITGTRFTREGYLVANARVARVGVQQYLGAELGKPERGIVSVYRPADEVFRHDSMASFAHRPVTIGHPQDGVAAENWKQHAVGAVGGDVARDGDFIRVPLVVMDAKAVREIQAGTREISMGYRCRLDFTDGTSPTGAPYQAVQRDIVINHAAIVPKGRAGAECRIGDGRPFTLDTSTIGAGTMHIQDAFEGVPQFSAKARFIAGLLASDTRGAVENGIHNGQNLVGNMRMRASGAFSGGTVTADSAGLTRAAEFMEGLIAAAQHRLQSGSVL